MSKKRTAAEPASSQGKAVRGSMAPFLIGSGGLLCVAAAVLVVIGPDSLPETTPYVEAARGYGVEPTPLLAAGLVLLGLGLLARMLRRASRDLAAAGFSEAILEKVDVAVGELSRELQEIGEQQTRQAANLSNLRQLVETVREENRHSGHKDALFRMAASVDQLGARIDGKVGEHLARLQECLYEIGSAVESSRDFLYESFQETVQELGTLSAAESLATGYHPGYDDQLAATPPDSGRRRVVREHEEEQEEEDGLRVLVDLDPEAPEAHGGDADAEGDEDEQASAEEHEDSHSLGILDQLEDVQEGEDDEQLPAPLPALQLRDAADAGGKTSARGENGQPAPPLPGLANDAEPTSIDRNATRD